VGKMERKWLKTGRGGVIGAHGQGQTLGLRIPKNLEGFPDVKVQLVSTYL